MNVHSYLKHNRFGFSAASTHFSPVQLAAFYGIPVGFNGAGKNVAVIELGGGYKQTDLTAYFSGLGLHVNDVQFHSINGAKNAPGDPNGADGEVMLDLCVIGGMAPGVQLHCYMANNTNAEFLAAINQAIADGMDAISISWGGPENEWPAQTIADFNAAFQKAASAGITVTVAAGDNGSGDGEPGRHVDFPASSPYVLACGGTSIQNISPPQEVVWNDGTQGGATGGGISALFERPAWQASANVPGRSRRGVPDVAGEADPYTGWSIVVDGKPMVVGGTSAVAPLWAALAVCLSQAIGKNVGFLNPFLYAHPSAFRDIVSGHNGTYVARPGYDCCTGLGAPVGTKLLAALKSNG